MAILSTLGAVLVALVIGGLLALVVLIVRLLGVYTRVRALEEANVAGPPRARPGRAGESHRAGGLGGAEPSGRHLDHAGGELEASHAARRVLGHRPACGEAFRAGVPGRARHDPFRALDPSSGDEQAPVLLELWRELGELSRGLHHQGVERPDRCVEQHGRVSQDREPVHRGGARRRAVQVLGAAPAAADTLLVLGLSAAHHGAHPHERGDPPRARQRLDRRRGVGVALVYRLAAAAAVIDRNVRRADDPVRRAEPSSARGVSRDHAARRSWGGARMAEGDRGRHHVRQFAAAEKGEHPGARGERA